MSRTDKTKPLWVRQREHGPVAVHDHTRGDCDLPPAPTREEPGTRCRWEHPDAMLFRHGCCAGCHKRACTASWQAYNKAGNRKRRHRDRLLTLRRVREANTR
ncbi:hypothetical protein ACIRPH_27365 [Nocardiopsis sp. NPDC101807]|uniref:hypothetical protein n=1 Tax=Nocardiopsis sp. NPDC101807 TaxID=3364339 RepID=UPI00382695ED